MIVVFIRIVLVIQQTMDDLAVLRLFQLTVFLSHIKTMKGPLQCFFFFFFFFFFGGGGGA